MQRREEIRTEVEEEAATYSAAALSVEDMPLNARAMKAIRADGIESVGDVLTRLEQGDDALLAITGVGQKALIDIKKYLRANGLIE
ncbi:MAG TPA: DNA-directed RNA polymerase subunit alpha C-terminal domain-containing protein [Anaerolineae bacterium]|nr:DNA-directed RNA polymerase subunit alpha C-terminal domain-containing protein [Anaerolineae bacterium]